MRCALQVISCEKKNQEVVEKQESGYKMSVVSRICGTSPFTFISIVAQEETIKDVNVLAKQISQRVKEIEQLLLL